MTEGACSILRKDARSPGLRLVTHITRPAPRLRQRAPVAQPGRCQHSRERCLGRLLKKAKATGSNPVRGSNQPTLGRTSARFHLGNPIPPRRKLSHLSQDVLLRLLSVHPSRIHRRLHQILELLLKGQQLPIHVSTMDTVRVIRVLSAMIFTRCHGHPTTLTTQSERHESDKNIILTRTNNLTGHYATRRE